MPVRSGRGTGRVPAPRLGCLDSRNIALPAPHTGTVDCMARITFATPGPRDSSFCVSRGNPSFLAVNIQRFREKIIKHKRREQENMLKLGIEPSPPTNLSLQGCTQYTTCAQNNQNLNTVFPNSIRISMSQAHITALAFSTYRTIEFQFCALPKCH